MSVGIACQATVAIPQRNDRPYLILGGMQVLDVVTTWVILRYWSMRAEGNPIASWFLEAGLTQGLALLLAIKLAVVMALWRKQSRVRFVSAVYGLVLANNLLFLALGLWQRFG